MINKGKRNVLGVLVDAVDYEYAVKAIMDSAQIRRPMGISALAVHGVMTGVTDDVHRHRLNQLELVTPDGQPVRWLLNLLYGVQLTNRVYGPKLTLEVIQAAADQGLSIYLYGSSTKVIDLLKTRLLERFPKLVIAGSEPSRFRQITIDEKAELVERVKASGAQIFFVGLGCPRQEVFAYEYREVLSMPVLAVGAAFDYHAGTLAEPPELLQRMGLQWLHRLLQEPKRLAKRYLVLNTHFSILAVAQLLRLWSPDPKRTSPPKRELLFG